MNALGYRLGHSRGILLEADRLAKPIALGLRGRRKLWDGLEWRRPDGRAGDVSGG